MKTIAIRCTAAVNLQLRELTPLQGDLKELSEANFRKLKTSILKNGITFPLFVWQDDGTNFILDGTQRDRALRKLCADGYDIPPCHARSSPRRISERLARRFSSSAVNTAR